MTDRRGFMKGAAALAVSGLASAQDASTLVVRNAAHVLTMDPNIADLARGDLGHGSTILAALGGMAD